MSYVLEIIVFLVILFLYIHVHYHLSTSSDLEVYEVQDVSKEKIEDMCNLKQPIIIRQELGKLKSIFNQAKLREIGEQELNIRNINDANTIDEVSVPLGVSKSFDLFEKDTKKVFYSENNECFLKDTALDKIIQSSDLIYRPPLTCNCFYDLIVGSNGVQTPLRYDLNFRNYFYVSSGSVKLKLIPPEYSKNLNAQTKTLEY